MEYTIDDIKTACKETWDEASAYNIGLPKYVSDERFETWFQRYIILFNETII